MIHKGWGSCYICLYRGKVKAYFKPRSPSKCLVSSFVLAGQHPNEGRLVYMVYDGLCIKGPWVFFGVNYQRIAQSNKMREFCSGCFLFHGCFGLLPDKCDAWSCLSILQSLHQFVVQINPTYRLQRRYAGMPTMADEEWGCSRPVFDSFCSL